MDVALWGGWARWYVTNNPVETRKDVDIIVSRKVCENFYAFASALYRQGFRNVWRIQDDNLDEYLRKNGLKQEPVFQDIEHGLSWRLPINSISLDINIEPSDFEALSGHETWRDPHSKHQTSLLKNLTFWDGCSIVFKDPIETDIGILSPNINAQLQLYRSQLDKVEKDPWFAEHGVDSSKLERNMRLLRP